ncbi:MAG: GNAT family N-acetyltransferase [Anaerolineae bacterium]|nr:GNAT family N-acetyltransferase [Anaerolineae bacterium]
MTSITMQPINLFSDEQLADAFNAGYQGYVMPVHVDAAFIRNHIHQHDINVNASCLAMSGETVAGIGLLGLREGRTWVGGIGVDTAFRRQGLGKQIMGHLIDEARVHGAAQVWLEVIETNTPAHNLYLSLGFRDVRQLLVIERAVHVPDRPDLAKPDGFKVTMIGLDEALNAIGSKRAELTPWQRQAESLHRTPDIWGWLVTKDGNHLAWGAAAVSPEAVRWFDIGGTADGMQALVAHFHTRHPYASGRLINLVSDDPAWPIFESAGYNLWLTQHEMVFDI